MINILLLILLNSVNSLECNKDISVKYNYCNPSEIIPDCNYINEIKANKANKNKTNKTNKTIKNKTRKNYK